MDANNGTQTSSSQTSSSQSDEGKHTAFVYGTLMMPDVFHTVCYGTKDVPDAIKKLHSFKPAVLQGYQRLRVQYADYPGMIENKDHKVVGKLVTGLTKANISKLDYFEGGQYERRAVTVNRTRERVNAKGERKVEYVKVDTEAYVFLNKRDLETKEWDPEEFCRNKLKQWSHS
ncbi:AIG2-like family-domain-containing protein [Chaetomium fimeti]|uniref:Putative gamma-glutamylcyclotransferase n=1 Tax=Chaetomium fimeti TaxID=1854472 RepID=A0AAE0HMS9_9PEZI|nr:AIG2-like family-domain-containing protein [Chaetomium fimeti]